MRKEKRGTGRGQEGWTHGGLGRAQTSKESRPPVPRLSGNPRGRSCRSWAGGPGSRGCTGRGGMDAGARHVFFGGGPRPGGPMGNKVADACAHESQRPPHMDTCRLSRKKASAAGGPGTGPPGGPFRNFPWVTLTAEGRVASVCLQAGLSP